MSGEASPLEKAQEIDRSVFDAVAGWSSPLLDKIMPALSIAASFSRLWMAIAALFAVFGGTKGRKTAVEGMAAIGVTSFLANVVLKGLTDRPRPTNPVPEERELKKPDSSSFPSGHTASAAAFSGVVDRAYPALWIPINTLGCRVRRRSSCSAPRFLARCSIGFVVPTDARKAQHPNRRGDAT